MHCATEQVRCNFWMAFILQYFVRHIKCVYGVWKWWNLLSSLPTAHFHLPNGAFHLLATMKRKKKIANTKIWWFFLLLFIIKCIKTDCYRLHLLFIMELMPKNAFSKCFICIYLCARANEERTVKFKMYNKTLKIANCYGFWWTISVRLNG